MFEVSPLLTTVSGVLKTSDMLKNETLKSYGPDSNLFIFSVDGVSRIADMCVVCQY